METQMGAANVIAKIPVKKIPWEKLLTYGPIIVEAAGETYKKIKKYFGSPENNSVKNKTVSLTNLVDRVTNLEKNELEQSELIQNIANQLNDITNASKIISNRSLISLSISILALILSLILLLAKFAN